MLVNTHVNFQIKLWKVTVTDWDKTIYTKLIRGSGIEINQILNSEISMCNQMVTSETGE